MTTPVTSPPLPADDIPSARANLVTIIGVALHQPGEATTTSTGRAAALLGAYEAAVRRDATAKALHDAARQVHNGAPDHISLAGSRFPLQSFYNEGVSPWLTDLAMRAEMGAGEPQTHADLEAFLREHGWTPGRRGPIGRMWTRDDRRVGVPDGITPADPEWEAVRHRVDLLTGQPRWDTDR